MKKQRVYELAKQAGLSNQETLKKLASLGISAKSHLTVLDEKDIQRFFEALKEKPSQQEKPAVALPRPEVALPRPEKRSPLERWLKIGVVVAGVAILVFIGAFIYRYFALKSAPPRTYFDFQLRIWQDVLEKEPKNALAHANLGYVYLQMKRYDQAIDSFETALKYDPKNVTALYNLGITYHQLKKDKLAVKNLKAAADAAPAGSKFLAYYKLAELYEKEKKYPLAIETYQKSIQDDPTMWNSYFKLGQIYEKTKQKDLALEEYKKAAAFNPGSTEIKEAIERLSK